MLFFIISIIIITIINIMLLFEYIFIGSFYFQSGILINARCI